MSISSQSPQSSLDSLGLCPLCGQVTDHEHEHEHEPSAVALDTRCGHCGCPVTQSSELLLELSRRAAERLKIRPELVTAKTTLHELPLDSLGLVQFVMELEQDFDVKLMEQAWAEDLTYGDIIRLVLKVRYPQM